MHPSASPACRQLPDGLRHGVQARRRSGAGPGGRWACRPATAGLGSVAEADRESVRLEAGQQAFVDFAQIALSSEIESWWMVQMCPRGHNEHVSVGEGLGVRDRYGVLRLDPDPVGRDGAEGARVQADSILCSAAGGTGHRDRGRVAWPLSP